MSPFQLRPIPAGLRLRSFESRDFDDCMRIYSSNRGHTLPDSIELMEGHLRDILLHYLVIEGPTGIVGCGGIEQRADINRADLCFGMVDRANHRCGIGTLLLLARLALVDCAEGEVMIFLETSHKTEGFYRRFGFEPISGYEARYGVGLNYVNLGLWLRPEMREDALRALQSAQGEISLDHAALRST